MTREQKIDQLAKLKKLTSIVLVKYQHKRERKKIEYLAFESYDQNTVTFIDNKIKISEICYISEPVGPQELANAMNKVIPF